MGTKKSRAWDHVINPIDTLPWYNPNYPYTCSHPKCMEKAEYVVSYKYVTGARGKVTTARRLLCEDHSEKFAIKYGLTLF